MLFHGQENFQKLNDSAELWSQKQGRVFNASDNQWVRNGPGLQLLEPGENILEKYLPVPALFWLSHGSFTSHYPTTDFPIIFPDFWSDYKSNELSLNCYGYDYTTIIL